jgi:hypothetical protein
MFRQSALPTLLQIAKFLSVICKAVGPVSFIRISIGVVG